MDITNEQLLAALNSLEMKGGMHQMPESLRQALITVLSGTEKKAVKRAAQPKPTGTGKTPE